MKRVNNLYPKICELDNIIKYSNLICSKTKNKRKVELFEEYYSENIFLIRNVLEHKNYEVGKYNIFFIHEPKLRLIMSQNINDKIINHLVANYFLVDVFDKTFIDMNIATRKNKGTHQGLIAIKKYLNEMKKNNKDIYYLKFDISKYFYSISHEIVKDLFAKKIKDNDDLELVNKIVDSTDCKYVNESINKLKLQEEKRIKNLNISDTEKTKKIDEIKDVTLYATGHGFPIGNMTSQIIAILYLNELDYYIKEVLQIKYYVRYMDDGILIHDNKEYLKECLKDINEILSKYKLKLNNKKTIISNINNGLDFLGYKYFIINNKAIMKVKNDCKKRFNRKLKYLDNCLRLNNINKKEYINEMSGYYGHFKWGSCGSLLKKISSLK